jgi:hypothetical protein
MPAFLIEHAVVIFTVVALAVVCFKHRPPRHTV